MSTRAELPLGLLLRFNWGEHRLHSELLRSDVRRGFSIGSATGVDFACGDVSGTERFELVSAREARTVRFQKGMKGTLWRGDESVLLSQAIESGDASPDDNAFAVTLGPRDALALEVSGLNIEALPVRVPEPVAVDFIESLDLRLLNVFGVVFAAAMLVIVSAVANENPGLGSDDGLAASKSLAHFVMEEKPKPKKAAATQQKKDTPSREGKAPPAKTVSAQKTTGKQQGPKNIAAMLAGAFGPTIGGDDGEMREALGALKKSQSLASLGIEGLGIKGDASGGGGGHTIGMGGIHSHGRGGRDPGYGVVGGLCGGLPCKDRPDLPLPTVDGPIVIGMDKELIRAVIHRHRQEIRYCYEQSLTQHPDAAGKTSVKFVINAAGTVPSSHVVDSTMHDPELETCVADRVRTWEFPGPPGGGIVMVTYPLVFTRQR